MTKEMDQATAKYLFERGALLVLLDVPLKTEIGIDMHSWVVAENFKGIKMIPPGLHFIYYSASEKDSNQLAPRTGFFRVFTESEIVLRKWNPSLEEFSEELDGDELDKFKDSKMELDRYCGPYPYDLYKDFISLSSRVTQSTIDRIIPESGFVSSVAALISKPSDTALRKENQDEHGNLDASFTEQKEDPRCKMKYLDVTRATPGQAGSSVTASAMDSLPLINRLLEELSQATHSASGESSDSEEMLAELQLSFLCFLIGQQYDSFEQWKRLIGVLCNSEKAVEKYESLYSDLISVLHHQLKQVSADFFVDIVSSNNFLVSTLSSLFFNIKECNGSETLKLKAEKFRLNITKRFKWDFVAELEDDEDRPVVVDEFGNY